MEGLVVLGLVMQDHMDTMIGRHRFQTKVLMGYAACDPLWREIDRDSRHECGVGIGGVDVFGEKAGSNVRWIYLIVLQSIVRTVC